jgi:hypothetical protein
MSNERVSAGDTVRLFTAFRKHPGLRAGVTP